MLAVGERAPDFTLPADDGRKVSLKDLRGKKVVLYFYPKDDVWKLKNLYGREYLGIERTTFLIDEAGSIAKIWRKVKVEGHTDEVLAAL